MVLAVVRDIAAIATLQTSVKILPLTFPSVLSLKRSRTTRRIFLEARLLECCGTCRSNRSSPRKQVQRPFDSCPCSPSHPLHPFSRTAESTAQTPCMPFDLWSSREASVRFHVKSTGSGAAFCQATVHHLREPRKSLESSSLTSPSQSPATRRR